MKVESYYTSSDARKMWQRLQTIMDYKGKPSRGMPSDAELSNELNAFYSCFKKHNTESCVKAPVVPDDCVISLSMVDVSKTF